MAVTKCVETETDWPLAGTNSAWPSLRGQVQLALTVAVLIARKEKCFTTQRAVCLWLTILGLWVMWTGLLVRIAQVRSKHRKGCAPCSAALMGARCTTAPGPAVLGARNWWEWKIFLCTVIGLYKGAAFGTAPGPALAFVNQRHKLWGNGQQASQIYYLGNTHSKIPRKFNFCSLLSYTRMTVWGLNSASKMFGDRSLRTS